MIVLSLSLAVCVTSIVAGFFGALTGLGGGAVIVPVLCLLFKIDLHYAIGASLVSVIATSSGAAAAYVREGYSNIRIGMFLEVASPGVQRRHCRPRGGSDLQRFDREALNGVASRSAS
jgi:uncharacterized protein